MPEHPRLADLQRSFFGFVTRPLGKGGRLAPLPRRGRQTQEVLHDLVKPNDRLSPEERVELYARQYWFRIFDSFTEDFPGVRWILGARDFEKAMRGYLERHPSRSFTLRNLGSRFPAWLARHGRDRGSRWAAAADMARLEWAEIESFDAWELPPSQPGSLSFPLALQPHIRLLKLSYPADRMLIRFRRREDRTDASNAIRPERAVPEKSSTLPRLRPSPAVYLAAHRKEFTVYAKRLEPAAFHILSSLQAGRPLDQAIGAVPGISRLPESRIKTWFAEWSALGWFVSSPA